MKYLYAVFGLFVVVVYAFADYHGYELRTTTRGNVPKGLRGARGGSRSFWYSGYHGGK